jgi:hypothetical protein
MFYRIGAREKGYTQLKHQEGRERTLQLTYFHLSAFQIPNYYINAILATILLMHLTTLPIAYISQPS